MSLLFSKKSSQPKNNIGNKSRKWFPILTVGLGIIVVGIFIAGIELVSKILLQNEAEPFLFDADQWTQRLPSYQQNWGDDLVVSYVDPHLGFAHNPNKHPILQGTTGFASYGMEGRGSSRLRLIALGGSTTDPLTGVYLEDPQVDFFDPQNWPQSLAGILLESGVKAQVLNGGVAGYSSNQELLKFIRDVIPLMPDVVVCLDGVNDLGFIQSVRSHPMVHPYQQKLLNGISKPSAAVLLPNTRALVESKFTQSGRHIDGVNMGTEVDISAAAQWEWNCRIMNAIAKEHGIKFAAFLQPILGYGEYNISPKENEMLEEKGLQYLTLVREFYDEARLVCDRNSFCVDLTNVFEDEANVYLDPRHQNTQGVQILAKMINENLTELGILEFQNHSNP